MTGKNVTAKNIADGAYSTQRRQNTRETKLGQTAKLRVTWSTSILETHTKLEEPKRRGTLLEIIEWNRREQIKVLETDREKFLSKR